jgi:glutathione S-transferase
MNMQLSRWQSRMRSLAMDISNSVEISKINRSIVPRFHKDFAQFPALKRWFGEMAAHPAIIRAYARAAAFQNPTVIPEDSRTFSLDKPLPPSDNRLKEVR